MNDQKSRELLADYIAGELDERQAAAFRAELEANPERRRLAQELEAAAAALGANVVSCEEAERRTEALQLGDATLRAPSASEGAMRSIRPRHHRLGAILRYAAVIVVAFGAGFFVRGWPSGDRQPVARPPTPSTPINERYVANFLEATQSFPGSSSFSRWLLTLARR